MQLLINQIWQVPTFSCFLWSCKSTARRWSFYLGGGEVEAVSKKRKPYKVIVISPKHICSIGLVWDIVIFVCVVCVCVCVHLLVNTDELTVFDFQLPTVKTEDVVLAEVSFVPEIPLPHSPFS